MTNKTKVCRVTVQRSGITRVHYDSHITSGCRRPINFCDPRPPANCDPYTNQRRRKEFKIDTPVGPRRSRRRDRGAEGVEGDECGEGVSPPHLTRGPGGAS